MSLPSAPPEEPAPHRSRVARRLLEQPLRNLGVGVTAIVLGTTAAFGGLEEAHGVGAGAPGEVKVDQVMEAAPFTIRIRRLLWVAAEELPGVYVSEDGDRWLAIVADIRNTTDASLLPFYAQEAVTVSGVDGLLKKPELDLSTPAEDDRTDRVSSDQLLQLADSSTLDPIQPGLTYQAVFLFEQKGTAQPAAQVAVQLVGHTLRPNSFDQQEMWLDPAVADEAELAVRPLKKTSAPDTSTDTRTDMSTDTGAAA
jgi:hypothetical protein